MPDLDTYPEDEIEEPLRRHIFARWLPVIMLAITLFAFRPEVGIVIRRISNVYAALFLGATPAPVEGVARAFGVLFTVFLLSFWLTFLFWLWVISFQALVPVRSIQDIYRLTFLLFLYIFRMHGPTVFIKDGQQHVSRREFRKSAPGIIVVDFNSAVVLEEMIPVPGLKTNVGKSSLSILELLRLVDPYESPRVRGTGIVFTRPWERIRGTVDLRPQFRIIETQPSADESDKRVYGYSRDGIEVSTNQWAIFTIGQTPEILQFAYLGDQTADNLRVITTRELPDGRVQIDTIADEFNSDPDELQEVHQFALTALRRSNLKPYKKPDDNEPVIDPRKPRRAQKAPRKINKNQGIKLPEFDPDRVFAAVFAQARTPAEETIPWVDLPRRVSIDFFREELSHINYDDLYKIEQGGTLPFPLFKQKVKNRLRNSGILAYQVVGNLAGIPLEEHATFTRQQLMVTEARMFISPKILRDRGIRIIASGFGELKPVSDVIYKVRLDAWRSKYQRDTNLKLANSEREAMREHAFARARAQRDLVHSLSVLFDECQTEEVLSMRIFQVLENLAEEPQTRSLLPQESINLLRSVHDWILPGESNNSLPGLPGLPRGRR